MTNGQLVFKIQKGLVGGGTGPDRQAHRVYWTWRFCTNRIMVSFVVDQQVG